LSYESSHEEAKKIVIAAALAAEYNNRHSKLKGNDETSAFQTEISHRTDPTRTP